MAKDAQAKPPRKPGRPSMYKEEFAEQAKKLYLLGLTDEEVAGFFEVSVQTLHNWRAKHPAFVEANAQGKVIADAEVAAKLFERATGYSHPAVKFMLVNGVVETVNYTEHYPPDTTAALKWLFNRQPGRWREKAPEGADMTAEDAALAAQEAISAAIATSGGPA